MTGIIEWIGSEPFISAALAALALFFLTNWWREGRIKAQLSAAGHNARLPVYNALMVQLWGLTALTLALWLVSGRSLAEIGLLGMEDGWRSWTGWGLALAGCTYMLWLLVQAARSRKARIELRRQIGDSGDLDMIRPETSAEYRRFNWVAITAGVTEEILFRGFLIAVFALWMPVWVAAIAALAVFIAGHSYQGPSGMLRILPISVILTLVYLLSGSLWPGIVLHAVVDLAGGGLFRITAHYENRDAEAGTAQA
ncbi:CPBP family intramembrane glutamic endopeptidase [Maricaulis sp.]|uniref:CPBP family intramembrane glutamic endopeptidase n=1 Tax=Maricaulis sp. TaxID=1486257 RepID=UPI002601ADFE|nr:CPBP family intramembrane glutamic endopeptidase [Maricaulis sp.]